MIKACIVIPCFNEASRFKSIEFLSFLESVQDIDFCFVNDGSQDNTGDVLKEIRDKIPERIRVVDYSDNKGKAEAVRCGILDVLALSHYQIVAFADADLATPLCEMERLIDIFKAEKSALIVMGSRIEIMGATIDRKLYRHFTGRIFATVITLLFHLNAHDTQCGAKVFDAGIAKIFEKPFISEWLFDVELLLRVKKMRKDYNQVVHEVPLNVWIEQGESKIRFSHLLKMPLQLARIYFKYKS